ncbi:MAG: hypothetical protein JWM80_2860, partial [Cyanobacteria bacterium RYN_339]|nr:hypothetical protein [Cyanobacteria bacterium RYN_339]
LSGDPAAAVAVLADALPALAAAGAALHLAHGQLIEAAARLATGDRGGAAVAFARADAAIAAQGLDGLRRRDRALWAELRPLMGSDVPAATPAVALDVRLFGALEVRVEGVRVERWPRKKAAAILACLVLRPRGLGLDGMAEWLGEGDGPGAMKIALAGLRKTLEPLPGPRRDGERYVLEGVAADVHEFEAAIRQGDFARARDPEAAAASYERASACYRGDLLADGFLAKHFHAERGQYRQQALAALGWLADHRAGRHDLAGAEAALVRMTAIAPTDEEPCLRLIGHLMARGQVERARQAYWDFRKALHAAPDAAFEARYRDLVGLAQA